MNIGCVSLVQSVCYTAAVTLLKLSASDRWRGEFYRWSHPPESWCCIIVSRISHHSSRLFNRFANENKKTKILCFELGLQNIEQLEHFITWYKYLYLALSNDVKRSFDSFMLTLFKKNPGFGGSGYIRTAYSRHLFCWHCFPCNPLLHICHCGYSWENHLRSATDRNVYMC